MARTWTVQPSPNPQGAFASGFQAVSCLDPGSCVAVGASSNPSGRQTPRQGLLVEQFSHGVWTIASTPRISGATSSTLSGVSCPVATFCAAAGTCVAVGNYVSDKTDTYRPLAERLAGSTWSVLPAPVPPHGRGATGGSEFTGVDCPATTLCEVVGNVGCNDTLQGVFGYGLTGSTWTYQRQVNPGPDPGSTDDAVSCSDTDACTSAGSVAIIGESAWPSTGTGRGGCARPPPPG
jgi:hypothetical protein